MRRVVAAGVVAVVAVGGGLLALAVGGGRGSGVRVSAGTASPDAPSSTEPSAPSSSASPAASPAASAIVAPAVVPRPPGTERIGVREAFRELSAAARTTELGEADGWQWTDERDRVVDFVVRYDPRTDLLESDERPNGTSVAHFVMGPTAGWREVAPDDWRPSDGYGQLLADYRPFRFVPDLDPTGDVYDPEQTRRTRADGGTVYVITGEDPDPETGRFRRVYRFDARGRLTAYSRSGETFRFTYDGVSVVPPAGRS